MDAQDRRALARLRKDPALRAVIAEVGPPRFHEYSREDLLANLLEAIVSQQLSGRVAAVIFGRLKKLGGRRFPDPRRLLSHTDGELRAVGLSRAKAASVRDLADAVLSRRLDLGVLPDRSDAEVESALVQIRGVGPWTAHMVLIFALRRPDVWPAADLGVRKALQRLLDLKGLPSPREAEPLGDRWKPYRSYACWYLWQMMDGG
jgi:3-methyladenine DNA glycosylase/8-oxoguanine DNA glycosylase